MTLRIILVQHAPGLLWIGPQVLCVYRGLFVALGCCWGWDHRDPLSLSLEIRSEPHQGAIIDSLTFCGFCLFYFTLDVSDAPEAAARALHRMEV